MQSKRKDKVNVLCRIASVERKLVGMLNNSIALSKLRINQNSNAEHISLRNVKVSAIY